MRLPGLSGVEAAHRVRQRPGWHDVPLVLLSSLNDVLTVQERAPFAALLTNRVHPTSANDKLIRLRPQFHTAVATAFGVGA